MAHGIQSHQNAIRALKGSGFLNFCVFLIEIIYTFGNFFIDLYVVLRVLALQRSLFLMCIHSDCHIPSKWFETRELSLQFFLYFRGIKMKNS